MSFTPTSGIAGKQPALSDLPTGTLTLLTEVITQLALVTAKVNALLAELRAAGVILP